MAAAIHPGLAQALVDSFTDEHPHPVLSEEQRARVAGYVASDIEQDRSTISDLADLPDALRS